MNNGIWRLIGMTLLSFYFLFLCTACSKVEALLPRYSDNRIELVQLIASIDANQSTAVAVDVVFIFDETLAGQISPLTARTWFDQKNQFQLQYPGKLVIFAYELVPNSHKTIDVKSEKGRFNTPHQKAYKVMTFADYITESSDYTLDISPFKKPIITLGNTALTIVEGSGK